MLRTPFIDLLGIDHPVVSAGMGGGHTSVELVARVSMFIGQSSGVIDSALPAGDVVRQIVADAEEILRSRLPQFVA